VGGYTFTGAGLLITSIRNPKGVFKEIDLDRFVFITTKLKICAYSIPTILINQLT